MPIGEPPDMHLHRFAVTLYPSLSRPKQDQKEKIYYFNTNEAAQYFISGIKEALRMEIEEGGTVDPVVELWAAPEPPAPRKIRSEVMK